MASIRKGGTGSGHLVMGPFVPISSTNFGPTPPIPPEPPVSAKATIISFQTPILLSQTSRAVAKLTQGEASKAWYQWQFLDGSTWTNANVRANNPATDVDHHYKFPRVGNFPIRLQTWDAPIGGHMTDQTGTPRVVTVQDETPTPEPPNPNPQPPGPVPIIHAAGKIFRTDTNEPWRYKGVSAFKLCRLFDDGQDIQPFLDAYAGYNTLRVWAYTDWAGTGWEPSTATVTRAFFEYCRSRGFLVEYTLLTNDSLARSDWAKDFVAHLAENPQPPIFIEGRNEPQTHSQQVSTARLRPALDASRFVYASGNYEISANAFGPYLVAHTDRDSEWPRRCHDLMEYFNGGGPHKPSDPSHKVPCIGDEPAKTQDVAAPQPPLTKADDWRAYFGGCSLLGGGATFHSETGKWGQVPTAEERVLAAAALEGLNAFPADAPLGAYSRPSDNSLRTYIVGNYMVRIRPTTPNPSFSGWVRTGTTPILWRRA
jgi:hypothetical protein